MVKQNHTGFLPRALRVQVLLGLPSSCPRVAIGATISDHLDVRLADRNRHFGTGPTYHGDDYSGSRAMN